MRLETVATGSTEPILKMILSLEEWNYSADLYVSVYIYLPEVVLNITIL